MDGVFYTKCSVFRRFLDGDGRNKFFAEVSEFRFQVWVERCTARSSSPFPYRELCFHYGKNLINPAVSLQHLQKNRRLRLSIIKGVVGLGNVWLKFGR